MNRREFFAASAASALAAQAAPLPLKKGLVYSMLPKAASIAEKFRMAKECGFPEVECYTTPDQAEAAEIKQAAAAAGVRIHSVMNQAHWKFPLSSADPAVVAESMKGLETSIRNAHFWGAETVLLVPAVVNPETRYQDAWTRSQAQVRKILPLAAELKVIIAMENVGNKFLLSPLEFARYVDEFKSPWVRAYFDVGNNLAVMYPQDWILTLGKRIVKLHFKESSIKRVPGQQLKLGEGDIDWKAVASAIRAIGYTGSATLEMRGGDEAILKDLSARVDKILAMA
jgi:L-ribulose-5-phosphate 3-epimerase